MPTRRDILLASVSRHDRLIEVGPSLNPIAPKSEGWNSIVIDHASQDELIAKYTGHPGVDVGRIEPVDYVWTGGPLSSAIPASQHGCFDALIASHVIEHTPDLIGFLDAATTLLKCDGTVILAIPDRRYCFDYFQSLTTTGQILEADAMQRSSHAPRLAFDFYAYSVAADGAIAWGQHPPQQLGFVHRLDDAWKQFISFQDSSVYQDIHAWRFVPASFELLLLELARIGKTDWRVASITMADGCEFLASLSRGGLAYAAGLSTDALNGRRMTLLRRILLEFQAQIDWLTAAAPGPELVHFSELRAELEAARQQAAASEAASLIDRQRVTTLEAQLVAVVAERDAVLASATWRATKSVRRLGEAVPVEVRRALRRLWQRPV